MVQRLKSLLAVVWSERHVITEAFLLAALCTYVVSGILRERGVAQHPCTTVQHHSGLPAAAVSPAPTRATPPPTPPAMPRSWEEHAVYERIGEPSGFPAFRIYTAAGALDSPPHPSPCRWERTYRWPEHRIGQIYYPVGYLRADGSMDPAAVERCGYPYSSSWAWVLREALGRFANAQHNYANFGREDPTAATRIAIGYGLLSVESYHDGEGPATTRSFLRRVLPQFWRSPRLLEQAFTWAMPHVVRVWRDTPISLRPEDHEVYLQILRHARTYLANFNYQTELAYLRRLERGECESPRMSAGWVRWERDLLRPGYRASRCTYRFTQYSPDGQENPYRKLEAWIFRRAHDGVPVPLMRRYLERILAELERRPS